MAQGKVFDKEGALARVEDDLTLLFELVEIFEEDFTSSIEAISVAVDQQIAEDIESAAHSIKSALGNIGAMSSFELAAQLEKAGRDRTLVGTRELFDRLKAEISKFRVEFGDFKKSS